MIPDHSVDLDLRELDSAFASLERGGEDLSAVWRNLAPIMREDQIAHFRAQEGPDGDWEPLAKATLAKSMQLAKVRKRYDSRGRRRPKGRKGPKPMIPAQREAHGYSWKERSKVFSARMMNATFTQWRPLELAIVSKIRWAGAQQHGATIGRGAKLPARPFLWLSDWFVKRALIEIRAHLRDSWRARRRFRR